MSTQVFIAISIAANLAGVCQAGVASKALQEAIEFTTRKFGKEVAEEGVETMAGKMTKLAARHGDEVVGTAFKKVGPRAGRIAGEAGEQGGVALRMLAIHGDDALGVAMRKESLGLVARHGDEAATALVRHGTVAEPLIERLAKQAHRAWHTSPAKTAGGWRCSRPRTSSRPNCCP